MLKVERKSTAEMIGVVGHGVCWQPAMQIRLDVPTAPGLCGCDVTSAAATLFKITAPTLPAVLRGMAAQFEALARELEAEGWGRR